MKSTKLNEQASINLAAETTQELAKFKELQQRYNSSLKNPSISNSQTVIELIHLLTTSKIKLIDTINQLNNTGIRFFQNNQYLLAESAYKKSHYLCDQIGELQATPACQTLSNMANLYEKLGRPDVAISYYEQAYQCALKGETNHDKLNAADTLFNIALLYKKQNKPTKALEYYHRSFDLTKKFEPDNQAKILDVLEEIITIYDKEGQYTTALSYLQQALDIYQQKPCEEIKIVWIYRQLSATYSHMSLYDKALFYFEKTLAIDNPLNKKPTLNGARLLHNMANIYTAQNHLDKAIATYAQALKIKTNLFEQANTPEEKKTLVVSMADTLHNTASIHLKKGDAVLALEIYEKILPLLKLILGPQHSSVAQTVHDMGLAYQIQKDDAKTLQFFNSALDLFIKAHGQNHSTVGKVLSNLAESYLRMNDFSAALNYAQQALTVHEQLYKDQTSNHILINNINLLATIHVKYGLTLENATEKQQHYQTASVLYERSLAVDNAILDNRSDEFSLYDLLQHHRIILKLTDVYHLQYRYHEAAQYYAERATKYAKSFPTLALQYIKFALRDFAYCNDIQSACAKLYILRGDIYQQLNQPSFSARSYAKAKQLSQEKEKLAIVEPQKQNLEHLDADIYVQLERCRNSYTLLQQLLVADLMQDKKLSDYVENRIAELIIKLNGLREQIEARIPASTDSGEEKVWQDLAAQDAVLAIANGSKHVCLAPQYLSDDLMQFEGNLIKQQLRLNIEYINPNPNFQYWHIAQSLQQKFNKHNLSDVEVVKISKDLLQLLISKQWINKKSVIYPLFKDFIDSILNKAPENKTGKIIETIYADLFSMLPDAYKSYTSDVVNLMMHRVLQRYNLSNSPDYSLDTHDLLQRTFLHIDELALKLANSRQLNKQDVGLKKTAPYFVNPANFPLSLEISETTLQSIEHEVARKLQAKLNVEFSELQQYHLALKTLISLYRQQNKHTEIVDKLIAAGQLLQFVAPWLSLRYYSIAAREHRNNSCILKEDKAIYLLWAELYQKTGLYILAVNTCKVGLNKDGENTLIRDLLSLQQQELVGMIKNIDADIFLQLQYIKERYYALHYLSFKLTNNIHDHLLNQTLQNEYLEIYTKIRHLLEQVLARFAKQKLFRPNGNYDTHQVNYPYAATEQEFNKMLTSETTLKGKLKYQGSKASIEHYPAVHRALEESQPFYYAKQQRDNESWVEKISQLSNQSKHEGLSLLSQPEFIDWTKQQHISSINHFSDLYPIKYKAETGKTIFISALSLLKRSLEQTEQICNIIFYHIETENKESEVSKLHALLVRHFKAAESQLFASRKFSQESASGSGTVRPGNTVTQATAPRLI